MADLAQQIRDRLDELMRPPAELADMFLKEPSMPTPEQLARFEAEFAEAMSTSRKLVVMPPSPIERMANAILAAVDEHQQAYALVWDVPRPQSGEPRRELHPWCRCQERDGLPPGGPGPCPTLTAIAAALGIAIHGSRTEGRDE